MARRDGEKPAFFEGGHRPVGDHKQEQRYQHPVVKLAHPVRVAEVEVGPRKPRLLPP